MPYMLKMYLPYEMMYLPYEMMYLPYEMTLGRMYVHNQKSRLNFSHLEKLYLKISAYPPWKK
jgi:hypothetical protein